MKIKSKDDVKGVIKENQCVEVTAGGVDVLSTVKVGTFAGLSLTIDNNISIESQAFENVGQAFGDTFYMGTAEETSELALNKICVIDRGNISFHSKVINCEDSGGIGAIIINSNDALYNGILGKYNSTSIPAVSVSLKDRERLLFAKKASISAGYSDYSEKSGTSMAVPAVSGFAALLWSNFENCSAKVIRNALINTAEDLGAEGRDDYFGHGIVNASAANEYLAQQNCETASAPNIELSVNVYDVSKDTLRVDLTWSGVRT